MVELLYCFIVEDSHSIASTYSISTIKFLEVSTRT